eukprot:5031140-Lingulodinium_polyedra.AAC.1
MARGEVELPKLGMGGGQFRDADHVLRALVADHQASEDGQLARAFAVERRDTLREKGQGKAMAK